MDRSNGLHSTTVLGSSFSSQPENDKNKMWQHHEQIRQVSEDKTSNPTKQKVEKLKGKDDEKEISQK